jgi:glycosyltransferase involved in cell wall biosynthesis
MLRRSSPGIVRRASSHPRIDAVRVVSTSSDFTADVADASGRSRPVLSIVVPVYNGGAEIVDNVETIRGSAAGELAAEEVEVIVVSDGSIDGSGERLLESRGDLGIRVIHYDRNLGKGYAVKAGALASRGDWVALVDADLDLDPAAIPEYLAVARAEQLDCVIGSKRHPGSSVQYPASRRVASWCYQQLNRFLFRLDVRDTQVGLKVFSRGVVDEVIPLLLVKRFAFDLELLAVATELGYGRIRELPVKLDYRFTGSGVGSNAALLALWDTAAIFYRLRILKTYERKRRLLGDLGSRTVDEPPRVTVVGDREELAALDYPSVEHAATVDAAGTELVAVLGRGAHPAGNWISAAVPFFADPQVAAVVAPAVSPLRGGLRERLAAAVLESRLGGGSRRSGYFPGNVRVVGDHPAETVVARRSDYLDALAAGVPGRELVAWLAERGRRTVYTPDTSLALAPAPLVRPHLTATARHGRERGDRARRTRGRSLSLATAASLVPALAALSGLAFLFAGGGLRPVGLVLVLACAAALVASGLHAALRFRSLAVGLLEPPTVVASQVAYLYGFIRGLALGRP